MEGASLTNFYLIEPLWSRFKRVDSTKKIFDASLGGYVQVRGKDPFWWRPLIVVTASIVGLFLGALEIVCRLALFILLKPFNNCYRFNVYALGEAIPANIKTIFTCIRFFKK